MVTVVMVQIDGDCSYEIRRRLLLERKVMTNLDSILKNRGVTLPTELNWTEGAQSCLTLCNPVDCSPPGSSIHGILQARILEWVAISSSRGSSQLRVQTQVSRIIGRRFNLWATRKGLQSQSYGFSSSHVWMWELDGKESWAPKNWCFWTVVLEKTLESPLDCKETQPVHPKGNQSWIFVGRTDAEAETAIVYPPESKNWLIGSDPDAGKDWRWEKEGPTGDEMDGITNLLDMSLSKLQEMVMDRKASHAAIHGSQRSGHDWATELAVYLFNYQSM